MRVIRPLVLLLSAAALSACVYDGPYHPSGAYYGSYAVYGAYPVYKGHRHQKVYPRYSRYPAYTYGNYGFGRHRHGKGHYGHR